MVWGIAESEWPVHLLVAPTGFGKSLTYAGLAKLTGWKTIILTATKALQDQLMRDFEEDGWVDVRGQSNYRCVAPDRKPEWAHYFRRGGELNATQGPCRWGLRCELRDGGCPYYDRVRQARQTVASGGIVVTNYDFWLHNRHQFTDVDLLVMDEAHQAPDILAEFLSFRLTAEMRRYFNGRMPEGEALDVWAEWAVWAFDRVKSHLDQNRGDRPPQYMLDMKRDLERMSAVLGAGDWVVEHFPDGQVWFDCIDAERFGQQYLWGNVGRVLMVSATINAMTARALGIPDNGFKKWEAKSGFPVERRPVWVVDGAPQVNFRMAEGAKVQWANLIDRIIGARRDRKGIVHTTSFERARYLQSRSQYPLLLNDSRSTKDVVEKFRRAGPGTVLVSPSVTTGWNFPGQECEYQIVAKIPFPDLRTKAAKVRAERNREWAGYQAAQTIVQESGRGMRSTGDRCETFIADGNFGWWYGRNRKFTPRWWQEAVQDCAMGRLPDPPDKLTGQIE